MVRRIYAPITVGNCPADPAVLEPGMLWFNTTDGVLRYFDGVSVIDIVSATSLDGIPVLPDTPSSPAAGDVWYSEADCGIQVFDGTCIKTITNGTAIQHVKAGQEVFVGEGSVLFSVDDVGGLQVDGLIHLCCGANIVSI